MSEICLLDCKIYHYHWRYAVIEFESNNTCLQGFMDRKGNIICMPKYRRIPKISQLFFFSAAVVESMTGKYGLVNEQGHEVLEPLYDKIHFLSSEIESEQTIAVVMLSGEYGFFFEKSQYLSKIIYTKVKLDNENQILYTGNKDKKGFISFKSGEINEVLPQYDKIIYRGNDLFDVSIGDEWKTINRFGKEFDTTDFKQKYDEKISMDYDLFKIRVGSKWGIINRLGDVVLEAECDNIYPFKNQFARVEKDGLFAFIDSTGRLICDFKYCEATNFFVQGKALVRKTTEQKDFLCLLSTGEETTDKQ